VKLDDDTVAEAATPRLFLALVNQPVPAGA
jgi:hypothetical protein